jgi:purine-binding chemotaxis protein CheW
MGVDVLNVQEVIRYQEMTRVPKAPPVIRGLINLRGQIVTALDLRERLGLPPRPSDQLPINVVIRRDGNSVSLLVDEIGDVIEAPMDALEPPPENLKGPARDLVRAVCKLQDRLLLALDVDRTLDVTSRLSP